MSIQNIPTRLARLEQAITDHGDTDLLTFGETVTNDELRRVIEDSEHSSDRQSADPREMSDAELLRILRPVIEDVRRRNG